MHTLAIFVALADADNVPHPPARALSVELSIDVALANHDAAILHQGRGIGHDPDTGKDEPAATWLVQCPDARSLVLAVADVVQWDGQRSFGVVGLSPTSTLVPADPADAALWLQQATA